MHLAIQVLSLASLQACDRCNKGRNILNKRNVQIPNWQDADQLAIYKVCRNKKITLVENMGNFLKSKTK